MAALSALLFDILSGSLSGHLSPKAFHPKDVCASLLSCTEGKFYEGQNHIVVALSILMLRPQFAFKKHLMKGQKKKWSQLKEWRDSAYHRWASFAFSISCIHHIPLLTKADQLWMASSEGRCPEVNPKGNHAWLALRLEASSLACLCLNDLTFKTQIISACWSVEINSCLWSP